MNPATVEDVFSEAEPDKQQYLVDPPVAVLDALATAMTSSDPDRFPPLRILACNDTLSTIRQHFPAGSRLQQLVESDRLALRKSAETYNTMLVSESNLTTFVLIEDAWAWLSPEENPDTARLFAEVEELWETAERYSLRTAPLSTALESTSERLDETFRQRFERAVAWAGELSDPTVFHEVRAALVLGAVGEQLHFDVSKWGENARVASMASFSRHKSQLEELGVVQTEDVPVEMGRPRQRLLLTAESRERYEEEGLDALLAAAATTEDIDVN